MKEMIKHVRTREEGFTLAELLIVVAIIAVLVAIAIPVFTSQMAKAEVATDEANCRSYYAELQTTWMTDKSKLPASGVTDGTTITFEDGQSYTLKQGTYSMSWGDKGVKVTYKLKSNVDHGLLTGGTNGEVTWGATS